MAHQTFWEDHGICVRYSAQSTAREITKLIEAFQADTRFDEVSYIVHDFTECTGLVFSEQEIEELSAKDAAAALSKRKHRVAVVSDRADVQAMIQVYVATGFHADDKLRLFSDIGAARQWAGADRAALRASAEAAG
jgi:hypothetical protein